MWGGRMPVTTLYDFKGVLRPQFVPSSAAAATEEYEVAVADMRGWRETMEDAHCMDVAIPSAPGVGFFAVFDGHGGSSTSKESAARIKDYVFTEGITADTPVGDISSKFYSSFLELDDALRLVPVLSTGEERSGSTAICMVMTPTHYIIANAGDSRAILVRKSGVVPLSFDHKPYADCESRRVDAAGGFVAMNRVNGDLAVSRSLGDFTYKDVYTLPPTQQPVSAEPDMSVEDRQADDDFVVIACDGIWDVMKNEDVAAWLYATTAEGCESLEALTVGLVKHCLVKGSRDNMSAIIIRYRTAPRPSPEAIAAWAEKERLAAEEEEKKRKAVADEF